MVCLTSTCLTSPPTGPQVREGEAGRAEFIADCRSLLEIPAYLDFDVVFHCKEPQTHSDLKFR
jgi:hypothetical protein